MNLSLYLPIFEALGHETRLKVFDFIYQSGIKGVRPKELIDQFGFDSGTLDFHLKKLISVGLIALKTGTRRGVYCSSSTIPRGLNLLLDEAFARNNLLMHNPITSMTSTLKLLH